MQSMTMKPVKFRLSALAGVALALLLGGCTAPKKPPVTDGQDAAQKVATETKTQDAAQTPTDADKQFARARELQETDPAAAADLFERAALQGHGDAAYHLGLMQDEPKRQVEWHSMAAAVGQVDAQYALGQAYLNGRGTAKEPAWGFMWFERAARAGSAKAQYAMGLTLATGLMGPAPREEALVWLLIARENGYADAGLMISMLQARMSDSAVQTAQERAAAWTNEPAGDAEVRATTRFAQYALGRLGFDAGLADGLAGERTEAAVQAFRAAEGLGAGGLDGRTLDTLRERLARLNR